MLCLFSAMGLAPEINVMYVTLYRLKCSIGGAATMRARLVLILRL